MTSLTTLFVVGPNEYVEFNESWGSKAFLHHIWDQSQTPLHQKDVAQLQLHSAGARISKSNPPRIEFPIVLRIKGKGSTYKATGKWISWDDLAKRNPLAVKPPPSLEDFIARGATVGTGPKLNPGEFASRNDPIVRIKPAKPPSSNTSNAPPTMTKANTPIMDLETDEDGWIGGSSHSIYASKSTSHTHASPPPPPKSATKPSPVTPGREKTGDAKSRSLLERMDMAQNLQTPPPKGRNGEADASRSAGASSTPSPSSHPVTSPFRTTPSQGIRRPGAKIPSPLPLTSPARNNGPVSPLNTRTPLSASHPIPETPLKLSQRGGPQTPATPHYPSYPHSSHAHNQDGDAARASGLGLGLTPLKTSVPLAPSPDTVRSPLNEALNLRGRAASNASIGSPLKSSRDLHNEPLALGSSGNKGGNGQIDAMLDRLRNARSGLGTSASMWAPKSTSDSSSSASTTSHTIGSGFSSSNLLGVQTGLDRKRPSHRPNGLQLSLGQEISVMQELEEKAEEDYPPSALSSATVGETFRIDPPDDEAQNGDQDGWQGTVVPPTPSLGCDSPSSDEDAGAAKPPSRSLDAFGWGSHASSEPRKSSLFSKLPSSSTLEANWSGDDDDDRKDDVEVFEDMQSRAKASSKEKRNNSYAPLPPPPINYAKSRTPSPTHHMLAKSPQLDGPADGGNRSFGSPSFSAPKFGTSPSGGEAAVKSSGQRLSPVTARSQLPSDDSDGDADVENEKPTQQRKSSKKHDAKVFPAAAEDEKSSGLDVEGGGGLEKKRSLKRDKSERIRGRRASQSKEKDVDKVKMSAAAPNTATVSLPTSTLAKKTTDDLAQSIEKVNLNEDTAAHHNDSTSSQVATESKSTATGSRTEAQQTPVANRVQSIPTVKDDLFSSPAEPKVELPGTIVAEEGSREPAAVKEEETVPATPEPSHAKTLSFDWAADDDELDDELPDLDDWGVTLTPAKPSVSTSAEAEKATDKPARNGRGGKTEIEGEKVWRRGGRLDAESKNKSKHAGVDESSGGRKGKGAGRELFPPSSKGEAGGPLGIRIAGRAKSASLSPEPESAASKPKPLPPASTPYGRWNKASSHQEELTIKGSSSTAASRKTPSVSAPKKESRPRIAADLGALAKLLNPVEEPPRKGASGSRKTSPIPDKGEEWTTAGKKKQDKTLSSAVGESIHAPPSVGDSMHAPKNRSGINNGGGGGHVPTGPRGSGGAGSGKKKSHGGGRK
ncbi:uncharacterized protein UTRI_01098_B [Ustilago trichophora]|uniref:Uncharacterized protein n=1 Tax=Ustilago trichophora TaxID=86804 RepID=A0A5C3DT54_9BASI|nr:uncharacterized protein UTRI_01098_B [Ustilago trichophora]